MDCFRIVRDGRGGYRAILEELRRPNGRLARAAVELGEELGR
jgi:hypothetical protein